MSIHMVETVVEGSIRAGSTYFRVGYCTIWPLTYQPITRVETMCILGEASTQPLMLTEGSGMALGWTLVAGDAAHPATWLKHVQVGIYFGFVYIVANNKY
jgi:hypothetical protein